MACLSDNGTRWTKAKGKSTCKGGSGNLKLGQGLFFLNSLSEHPSRRSTLSCVNGITIAIFRNGFDNFREEKEDEEEDDSYNDNSDGYENNVNSDDGDNDNRDMIISDGAKKRRRRSDRERQ